MAKEFYISNKSNRCLPIIDIRPVSENDIDASYDERGNLLKLSGTQNLHWNYRDNIAYVDIITRPSGKNDSEYYVYDSSGQRVRKVTETYQNNETNSTRVEKIYFGDIEVTRTYQESDLRKEKYTVDVMDDKSRVALHHYYTKGSSEETKNSQSRYQLSNHLDSVALELNDNAEIMTYEEYLPFGGTALIAGKTAREVTEKEYRYSGKEKDESTGLYYYGARYYAPWLLRWINPDPAGTVDGLNLYLFVGGNSVTYKDIDGKVRSVNDPSLKDAIPTEAENSAAPPEQSIKETKDPINKESINKFYLDYFEKRDMKKIEKEEYKPKSLKDFLSKVRGRSLSLGAEPLYKKLDSLAAVNLYTNKPYKAMNKYVETGAVAEDYSENDLKRMKQDIINGILQLPLYQKFTYRGTTAGDLVKVKPNPKSYNIGEFVPLEVQYLEECDVFKISRFISSSSNIKRAKGFAMRGKVNFASSPVLMTILGHSAVSIEEISDYPSNEEKLFSPDTEFHVLRKSKWKDEEGGIELEILALNDLKFRRVRSFSF